MPLIHAHRAAVVVDQLADALVAAEHRDQIPLLVTGAGRGIDGDALELDIRG